ncbi:glycosyltransferase [Ectothiorhodospira haloalkaliphila]|uniref:glycosyltransferase n=1 Tax=Ectothiorhodospira haloalkaliphila TaxID=421628 RepID=UPI002378A383|nr:glycosyltransferase [Ectothiorhodospira haloalkaliphila]
MAVTEHGATPSQRGHIVLFGDFAPTGGIQRTLANMVPIWAALGHRVTLLTFREGGMFYPEEVAQHLRHHHLGTRNRLATVLALARYLHKHPANVLFSSTHSANVVTAVSRWVPGLRIQRYVGVTNPYGCSLKHRSQNQRQRKFREVRRFYPMTNGVIAISEGVRKDLLNTIGLARTPVHVIHNAVVCARTREHARAPVSHPWLQDTSVPVIVSAGRLAKQKDYPTLLRAMSELRQRRDTRLIILGEGPERTHLTHLIVKLGLEHCVDMPGFVDNPYAWMAKAQLFVLSSAWEGFGNVLAEALFLGVPVVATDCPGGPGEILNGGQLGELVAVGDSHALADAMARTLSSPTQGFDPDQAARRFTADHAARAYLKVFGL